MQAAPYLYRYATNAPDENVRPAEGKLHWLSTGERQVYARLADPRRRAAFLAGRILAKRLILFEYRAALRLGAAVVHPTDVDIDSGLLRGQRECPRVKIAGQPLPWSLSLAHTQRAVLVALGRMPGVRVGVDLVEPVVLPRGFSEVWFTAAERRSLREGEPGLAATLWAIKEAVYKAAGAERPFTPRTIEVLPHQRCGFVSRPVCTLAVWQTPQGETAVVAHTFNKCVGGKEP
jgi:phosphopantetheinyl transferase (holo-ACP synthase)